MMGVLSGKDIFTTKYITAEITDAASRLWFVPIKYILGDYFLAELDKQVYCFKFEGSRIKTYRHTLVKSFRVLQYDTNHYLPISTGDNKLLEDVLRKNSLPKVNNLLYGILKLLGRREKAKEFTPHALVDLVKEVSAHQNEYKDQVQNIINYLEHLQIEQIVTPVRKLSEFLESDLIATDPKFLGDIVTAYQRTDVEHKKITNTPITGKIAWLKIIAIITIVGLIGGIGYMVYSSGMLSNLSIPGLGLNTGPSKQTLMEKYPTPEALKAAIDRGEVKYSDLPPDIKSMVDKAKVPVATPVK